MKTRFTGKVILIGISYLFACGTLVFLWDFALAIKRPFFSSILAGILTIIGGFLLAYWLIENVRIEREAEQRKRELARKKRVLSVLKVFRNLLIPWLFHYATTLSGRHELYTLPDSTVFITGGKYKDYIPQLEDIFGIAVFDKKGKQLRGTKAGISDEILEHPFMAQSLHGSFKYGLRMLEQAEGSIKEFPSFVEEVDLEVARIVHIPDFIKSCIAELKRWEEKYGNEHDYTIDSSPKNLAIRHNSRVVGRLALDVVIAIDTDIKKLESEL